jgi:RNA polymerase sigma factor (sigma-70 family)
MRDDPTVVALLAQAGQGVQSAWDQLVERYAPLVWSICRRYGVTGTDADDVGGVVWLTLVTSMATIRDPAALPGWLATTARRECLALLHRRHRQIPVEEPMIVDDMGPADESLLIEERRIALRDACAELPDRDRELLSLLFADPPVSYAKISARLGMPIGAIGPTRQRCLERLRRCRALATLCN